MKRQVRVMLKELNRLNKIYNENGRFLAFHKPMLLHKIQMKRIFLKSRLRKWGVK